MARSVFYSFHYKPDNWRASQVRNMGVVEGNRPVTDNAWEAVTRQGDDAIKQWINGQLKGKSCAVVLIGANTAGRKWIDYEIKKAWNDGKGLLGIYIHNLLNKDQDKSNKGPNPFYRFLVGDVRLSSIVDAHEPLFTDSKQVYNYIRANLADWVEEAIAIRNSQ